MFLLVMLGLMLLRPVLRPLLLLYATTAGAAVLAGFPRFAFERWGRSALEDLRAALPGWAALILPGPDAAAVVAQLLGLVLTAAAGWLWIRLLLRRRRDRRGREEAQQRALLHHSCSACCAPVQPHVHATEPETEGDAHEAEAPASAARGVAYVPPWPLGLADRLGLRA
jgi:hypothetical protein